MLKNKWARVASSIASLLIAGLLVIMMLTVFASLSNGIKYDLFTWSNVKDVFASAFLVVAVLALFHVAYDMVALQKGVGKRALMLGSFAFVGLTCVCFAFFVETAPEALLGTQAAYIPLAAEIFGIFAGLFGAKALMNAYFGIGWHEYATPRLIKKIKG
ncbi:Uncharacterised protein [Candidatus Norongarragalina meridionalis]|nr:Uncharacterised protein [Candidatus Norongarragalina meridionalis]